MFFEPPPRFPWWLRLLVWIGDWAAGRKMMPSRLLSWYPRALISSGIFEGLVTHKDRTVSGRILKLVRMQVSFVVSCAFCIDMNSFGYEKEHITNEEIEALQGIHNPDGVPTFSERERVAVEYARSICKTPISFENDLIERLKHNFTEREIVILASTAAQVNYWTRLIQALGIMPAGFTDNCPILKLDSYKTK
ncbi:MAG: carboxymuconolactone decarboxylase family protein [Spirochaetes bacterium]|nr:carboxymuconolactone decarboxylase family protein [Spirochaetota bacterium]